MKWLGIDYGKKKVGLALSEGEVARAWKVVSIGGLVDAISKIGYLVKSEEIEGVVVGLPESNEARLIASKFISEARRAFGVEVIEVDESLTTKMALDQVRDLGVKRGWEDALAAALILQNYLDSLK